jgi:cytochrome c-type biogenesis protein CcsB
MNSSGILSIITFVYGLAAVCYIFGWIFKKPAAGKLGTWILLLSLAGNILGVVMRWVESYQLGFGHAPLSNLYESLIFFAATIALISLFIERKFGNRAISAFTAPLAFLAMAYASLSPNISDRIQPLIPALKSNWLIAHVIACFIGYGAFAVAFGVSIVYLMKHESADDSRPVLDHLPNVNVLDELTHQLIMFGFLFLSAGIITGAVWANSAWGRYWGWDPKETWSLITWFVYAILLHARLLRGWRGKRIAVLSIVGFAAVLFTYFGVNLLPGLHSYGSF